MGASKDIWRDFLNPISTNPDLPQTDLEGTGFMNRTVRFLITYHLPLMISLSVGVLVFEIYDHTIDQHLFLTDFEFWVEVITYGFLLPILGVFVLRTLEKNLHEREQATQSLDKQLQFKQKMTGSTTWDQLVESIVQYPRLVLPVRQTALHVNNQERGVFELASFWRQESFITSPPPATLSTKEHLELFPPSERISLVKCSSSKSSTEISKTNVYCLPLHRGDELIAILHVELPAEITIPSVQARYLADVAPEMALMLSDSKFSRYDSIQDETLRVYRKQVARDLHDTLGQNISYLRLQCEILAEQGDIRSISDVRKELERMREAADQAYLQMRAGLETLNPSTCENMITVLKSQAEAIGERANFQVHIDSHCDWLVLEPDVRREILQVSNEAFHNVEKHAQAHHLSVRLYREADDFRMQIEDDGIGFDLERYYWDKSQNGHYGLTNMRQRIEKLNGKFLISSTPGDGTSVSLKVPLSPECVESP
jgi:signal transduction histidine kinase